MTFERWNYLFGVVFTAAVATYLFRAAETSGDAAKATRMRTNAWVEAFLGVLALLELIFDPQPRYPR